MIIETAYANDGVHGGISYVSMGGRVTRRCDHGDCESGGDDGTIDVDLAVA